MSIPSKGTATCPKCHGMFSQTIWESVNTDLSPDLPEKVISGEFFTFRCPHCGHTFCAEYTILYHDMKHRAMVWLVTPGNHREDEIRNVATIPGDTTRLVRSGLELAEKVSSLEAGRDDRVIELYKLLISPMVADALPQMKNPKVYYTYLDGTEYFEVVDEARATTKVEFDTEQYEKEAFLLKKILAKPASKFEEVDQRWALAALDLLEKEAEEAGMSLEQYIKISDLLRENEILIAKERTEKQASTPQPTAEPKPKSVMSKIAGFFKKK